MPRFKLLLSLTLATLSATAWTATSVAQAANPAGPENLDNSYTQSQPAPIERAPSATTSSSSYNSVLAPGQTLATTTNFASSQPSPGVYVRVGQNSSVRAIAASPNRTELSVERGIANINIHHPASGEEIMVDLPGGQTALLKDGLYTFNASSNTVRVLKGEADAYPGGDSAAKPIKVKEDHAVTFDGAARVKAVEFQPFQARTDLIPYSNAYAGNGGNGSPYGYGPYGDGFAYGYPYYAYGYPYGYWGDPYWGYGYPFGFGIGFGYGGFYRGGFGGFHGGGFHGGGFHGGGFHGR